RYRPQFYARPPSGADPLLVLRGRTGSRLAVGPGKLGHLYVEDALGDRIADLHPSEQLAVEVFVPDQRPLFVRLVASGLGYRIAQKGSFALARLAPTPMSAQSRGAEHAAFSALFREPFDRATLEDYRTDLAQTSIALGETEVEWPRPALGIAGVALGVAGGML